jgi:L-iditol 2-dehydrogenase
VKRLAKGAGYGNVYLEEVPVPTITPRGVLVRAHTSLISRGSEILRRYRLDGPVDPAIMGYSLAGTVVEVGGEARAAGFAPGDRVFALSPHAEYVAVEVEEEGLRVRRLPDELPWHRAPFQSLAYGAVAWAEASQARPGDTVVVGVGRLITVDALAGRVRLSAELGADAAVHGGPVDAVAEVRRLTDGRGADVVVDCVGGPPGVRSFEDALEMVKDDGTIHLIGLYHGRPLPLDAGKIQRKLLIGGYHVAGPLGAYADRAAALLASGQMRVEPLITHRFPSDQAPAAFALLDQQLDQALGVLLEWPPG